MQERGVVVFIKHGVSKLYHPVRGLIVQTKMSANRMSMLHAIVAPKTTNCFQTTFEDNTHLWHYKYGHLNYKGLRILQHKQMVRGLP